MGLGEGQKDGNIILGRSHNSSIIEPKNIFLNSILDQFCAKTTVHPDLDLPALLDVLSRRHYSHLLHPLSPSSLTVSPITGGNINYAFLVSNGPLPCPFFFVKQAPPYVAFFGPDVG